MPVVEHIAPAPAVFQASSPAVEHIAPAPAVFQASSPVVEFVAPAPEVFQASPVVEKTAFVGPGSESTWKCDKYEADKQQGHLVGTANALQIIDFLLKGSGHPAILATTPCE